MDRKFKSKTHYQKNFCRFSSQVGFTIEQLISQINSFIVSLVMTAYTIPKYFKKGDTRLLVNEILIKFALPTECRGLNL